MYTFADPLIRAAKTSARSEALVCGDVRLTFGEFLTRCRKVSGLLDQLGIAAGERVALLAANSHQYVELYCAVPASGRVIVPLNTRWAEPELQYALDDGGATTLIIDREPGTHADSVDRVISLTDEYETMLADAPEGELGVGIDENTLAGLFYTGGTTGASKGVMLTHRNLIANTMNSQMSVPLSPDDRYLVIAPLFHAAGSTSVLQCIWLGVCQVIVPAFTPALALDLIESEGITNTLGVPTMVAGMVEEQKVNPRDVSTLGTFTHGGSPIALEVVRQAKDLFPVTELVHLYGATETAPLSTALRNEGDLLDSERGKSAGQSLMGVEVAIIDDTGDELPPGEVGEVAVRGANVMAGYWNKPEQTKSALNEGWYRSGDLGRMDDEGYLFLVDRAKDMMVSGGENVYGTEVEDAIYQHPKVLEATVFGIPSEQWGEAVHAVVVPRDDLLTADELIEHCRALIAGYKVPRSVEFRTEPLPVSGPGKVLKRELRAPYWEGRDSQI
ncbi:MAG: AMP-binding protein [Actinomycetia bacterium]|nr:AMP-binding protein [Actinomycetes bacterium]MCP3913058.1 AMP-binding protein [Actinomycetes bacterium]